MKQSLGTIFLIVVLLFSFVIRIIPTYPGYHDHHPDQGITYSAALSMIKNNNFNPLRYDYPAVVPLTNYVFFKTFFIPLEWAKYYFENTGNIIDGYLKLPLDKQAKKRVLQKEIYGKRDINVIYWSRFTTALIGTGVVFLTFLLSKDLFNKKSAFISTILISVNYKEVINSTLGLPDIYNAFFLLLSVLFSIKIYKKPTTKNYILASIAAGLSFSTKYQFFSFFPLFLAHLKVSRREGLFSKNAFLVIPIILLVFILINPYHFIHLEETHAWLTSVSGKYKVGKNELSFFGYSYLYHTALGKIAFTLGLISIFVNFIFRKKRFESLILFSVISSFFYITTFYTNGGFYTRNFVTIIPFVFVSIGYFLERISNIKPRILFRTIVLIIVLLSVRENIARSIVVAREYSKPWNETILNSWLSKNLREGVVVAAHPTTKLPITNVKRIKYDYYDSFSLEEFRKKGAMFSITNLELVPT